MLNIIVKHYLNKRLKPLNINGLEKYPVYIRVTYARKNHKINSTWIVHKLSEYEFENDLKIQQIKEYESDLIKDILTNGKDIDNVNLRSRLLYTQQQVSECFFEWTLGIQDIKQELINYMSNNTGLSKEIFEKYVRLADLYYPYWLELANKKIFDEQTEKRLIYFALLLKFESLYYPNNSFDFAPGEICNYYEWGKLNIKKKFLSFVKNENLLPNEEINNITEVFDNHLIEWRSFDMRG